MVAVGRRQQGRGLAWVAAGCVDASCADCASSIVVWTLVERREHGVVAAAVEAAAEAAAEADVAVAEGVAVLHGCQSLPGTQ